MSNLTRYTAKFYKDSSKTFYAVFISAGENPIEEIKETSLKYSYTLSTELLSDGSYKHVLSFFKTTTGTDTVFFNILFKDGTSITSAGQIPSDAQILVSPHDSLSFSTIFSEFDTDSKTYSVSDSIYYAKSSYKALYIFPSSSVNYLDTSSTEDFYYVTSGSAAYIGSNELQNNFLISSEYSVTGVASNQLGKFIAGNGIQILNFSQYTDASKVGPAVYGYVYVNTTSIPTDGNVYNVSKNPASSNYYLKGCTGGKLPCDSDGTAFSDDCHTGVTLTATVLNDGDNTFQDGGCSATCEGFSLKIVNTQNASSANSADGKILVEVIGGTANYTFVRTATDLAPGLTLSVQTVSNVTTAVKEFTGLYAGRYTLKVTDSNTSACKLTETFVVTSETPHGAYKGCTQSGAINYDDSVTAAQGWDAVCVYCPSSGLLTAGADTDGRTGRSLGPFIKTTLTIDNATSISTTGVAQTDGIVTLTGVSPLNYVLASYNEEGSKIPVELMFNSGDYFTGGTDYEYKLYSLNKVLSTEYEDATYLAANGTHVETKSNAGGTMQFTGLPNNDYAIKISYTKDGVVNEYEDCYIIEQFSVKLRGCTDPKSDDYNPNADIDDGSCRVLDLCELNLGLQSDILCPDGAGGLDSTYYSVNISTANYYNGTVLVGGADIMNDSFSGGGPANPANCYYAVELGFSDGSFSLLSNPSFTFYDLANPESSFGQSCEANKLLESVRVMFSYGGTINPNLFWTPDSYLNQGDCEYNSITYVNGPDVAACCVIDGPDTEDVYGCMDSTACNYNPLATVSLDSCEYTSCITFGCTDLSANNYNPEATDDDGSCTYDILGCTDSEANNYNSLANVDDGTCTYDPTDCSLLTETFEVNTSPSLYASSTNATYVYNAGEDMCIPNSDGTLTITLPTDLLIANGVTSAYWLATVTNTSTSLVYSTIWEGTQTAGVFTTLLILQASVVISDGEYLDMSAEYVFEGLPSGLYNIKYYISTEVSADGLNIIIEPNWCSIDFLPIQFPIGLNDCEGQIPGCTDPLAYNFNSAATDDDGTCEYAGSAGCTDIYAVNYNPNVLIDDGSCSYQGNPCAPPTIGTCVPNIYTDNSTDSVSSCCIPSDIENRLDSIEECLANSGSRFYNKMITGLSDSCSTMDAWKMLIILEILRKRGLPCVYNCSDAATQALGGLTCDSVWAEQGSTLWVSTSTYNIGSVVKSPVDNNIYVATSGKGLTYAPNTTVSGGGNNISGWQRCCDEVMYSENINYLTNFIAFVEKYCKDCEIPGYAQIEINTVKVNTNFTIGGLNIENNGASFEVS